MWRASPIPAPRRACSARGTSSWWRARSPRIFGPSRARSNPAGAPRWSRRASGFGRLARGEDGAWDTSGVTGLPPQALSSSGASNPPSLILQPWHQVGNVVSIRQFTTNAFNHHHGMQAEERVGAGVDQAGDAFVTQLTRAAITAPT